MEKLIFDGRHRPVYQREMLCTSCIGVFGVAPLSSFSFSGLRRDVAPHLEFRNCVAAFRALPIRRCKPRTRRRAASLPDGIHQIKCSNRVRQARRYIAFVLTSGAAFVTTSARAWAKTWQRGADVASLDHQRVAIAEAITNSGVAGSLDQPVVAWPFNSADFQRWNEEDDSRGFVDPSFERHIDDAARQALERLYASLLVGKPLGLSVVDLCASWDSHLPASLKASRIALVGMNRSELEANGVGTETHICDLNRDPHLPFRDGEFDVATLALSIQYLKQPREVFSEMHRVLRSGGLAVVSFSSRSFPWKVVSMWSRSFHDGAAQCRIVGTYFRFSPPGGWTDVAPLDLSPHKSNILGSDPLWAVVAVKV